MGLLDRGRVMRNRRANQANGLAATYRRGARSCPMTVRPGNTVFSGLQEAAVSVQRGERDYLFDADALVLDEVATTPQDGDRIEETVSGLVYEVREPQTGEPAWRWSGNGRQTIRVHTRRVPT